MRVPSLHCGHRRKRSRAEPIKRCLLRSLLVVTTIAASHARSWATAASWQSNRLIASDLGRSEAHACWSPPGAHGGGPAESGGRPPAERPIRNVPPPIARARRNSRSERTMTLFARAKVRRSLYEHIRLRVICNEASTPSSLVGSVRPAAVRRAAVRVRARTGQHGHFLQAGLGLSNDAALLGQHLSAQGIDDASRRIHRRRRHASPGEQCGRGRREADRANRHCRWDDDVRPIHELQRCCSERQRGHGRNGQHPRARRRRSRRTRIRGDVPVRCVHARRDLHAGRNGLLLHLQQRLSSFPGRQALSAHSTLSGARLHPRRQVCRRSERLHLYVRPWL